MRLDNLDEGRAFDWGNTSGEYAKYRDIYPSVLYDKLRALGVGTDGSAWLDIGTGTGIIPLNMYNKNAETVGVDISEKQIEIAKKIAESNGFNIKFFAAPAENMGLPDGAFDFITAAQCFWYFERARMIDEIKRMLKPDGVFIKIFLNWNADDEIAKGSIELVKKYNPKWDPDSCVSDVFDDLFDGRVTEIYDVELPFTRESWHGRMCACRGTLASMDEATFNKWNDEHLAMLERYPESFTVKHKLYISYFKMKGQSDE